MHVYSVFKNKVWKYCHAVVTSGIKNSLSQSHANKSSKLKQGFALGILQFLIATTVQWSLTSSGRIPVWVYLWGLFVSMTSIRVDLFGFSWLGCVGDSISWVSFTESQYDLNRFEFDDTQFQFKSPSNTSALESRSVKKGDSEVRASLTADGQPTMHKWSFFPYSRSIAKNSKLFRERNRFDSSWNIMPYQ